MGQPLDVAQIDGHTLVAVQAVEGVDYLLALVDLLVAHLLADGRDDKFLADLREGELVEREVGLYGLEAVEYDIFQRYQEPGAHVSHIREQPRIADEFDEQILNAVLDEIRIIEIFQAKIEHELIVALVKRLYGLGLAPGGKPTKLQIGQLLIFQCYRYLQVSYLSA